MEARVVERGRDGIDISRRSAALQDAERLPGYGYEMESFSIEVEGVTLAGTLFLPQDRTGPVPGAVIIHGSGASDRDNYWYMMFADTLVRSGLAVVLPDKRGSGMKRDRLPGILDAVVRPISLWVVKRRRPEWWATNGPIDPIQHWADVTAPAVTLYGRLDELDNVPVARSVERLDSLGLPNMDVWVFEGVGHGLMVPDPNRVRADVLERLAEWVTEAVSPGPPSARARGTEP